jgi:competence protein ComEC
LDAILDSAARYHEPRCGEVVRVGQARVEVLNPRQLTGDFHQGCIAVRVIFGSLAFMLTGDVEVPNEREMLDSGYPLQAQILKLGHHGSRTSSSQEFLQAVRPEVAIYSAGRDNSYGHPHQEVMQRVRDLGIALYGTTEHGTIRLLTDGQRYEVQSGYSPVQRVAGAPASGGININTASKEDLMRIAHLGAERAERLIRQRPFRSLDQLRELDGIGDGRLQDIKAQGLARVE